MSKPLIFTITESIAELKSLIKKSSLMMQPRLRMLLLIKKAGDTGISKRALMDDVCASSQSIHNWRTAYKNGGIENLLSNGRKGKAGRPSVFSKDQQLAISKKLNDPKNNLRGYKELQAWIKQEFKIDIKYNTVLVYSIRKHQSSVKVARKSHVKKDVQMTETFKKTSVKL
jgi:transposase